LRSRSSSRVTRWSTGYLSGLRDGPNYPLAAKYLTRGFGGIVGFGIKGGAGRGGNSSTR